MRDLYIQVKHGLCAPFYVKIPCWCLFTLPSFFYFCPVSLSFSLRRESEFFCQFLYFSILLRCFAKFRQHKTTDACATGTHRPPPCACNLRRLFLLCAFRISEAGLSASVLRRAFSSVFSIAGTQKRHSAACRVRRILLGII